MENIAFDIWLSNRMQFSAEDKRECFEMANTIVQIATDVRKSGLLSLEDKIPEIKNILLQKAVQLAVDSTESDTLVRLLQTHIVANNYKGKDLLDSILIKEGVKSIIEGCNPRHIQNLLLTYFGDNFLQENQEYIEEIRIKNEDVKRKIVKETFWKEIRNNEIADTPLDELVKGFDNVAMQTLIRESDPKDLIMAFKKLSEQSINQFLSNMSKRSAEMIMEDFVNAGSFSHTDIAAAFANAKNIREREVIAAQERILAKIEELKESGQIVVIKKPEGE